MIMPPHDVIIKIEEPDYDEEHIDDWALAPDDDIDTAVAAVDENLHVYGVKVWKYICDTVKLRRSSPRRRELCRKCTGLLLKRDPDVHDRSLAKCLAARYKEHGLWAGTLNRFAVVIRNKLRPKCSRAIPLVVIEGNGEEGASMPRSENDVGGVFPRVEIANEDLARFHKFFCLFCEKLHEAYLVEMPDVKPQTLENMVMEAFKGEKNIRTIAKNHVEVAHFRRICNAVAALHHAYSHRMNLREEDSKACTRELMKFCQKYGFMKDNRSSRH